MNVCISDSNKICGRCLILNILMPLLILPVLIDACTTPNGNNGECKSLNLCQPLRTLLQRRPLPPSVNDYLTKSICDFEGRWPKVCCPMETSVNKPVLPNKDSCGVFAENRIFGGTATKLDEFPWMAILEYQNANGKRKFYCGGVLISEKYVLTAAHCIKRKIMSKTKLVNVRLGEYNTLTDPDCFTYGNNKACAPSAVTIAVEEEIPHPDFNPSNVSLHHDIALLRLKESVNFTSYIKPICLPTTSEELYKSYTGRELSVAGWGVTESGSESNIKLKVQVPVKEASYCISVYRQFNISLGEGQMCAGGEKNKDSCRGDSGGPLMGASIDKEGNVHWYAVGVVSFGPIPCGLENKPGVYTKVSKYVEWIISKMRP